MAPKRRKFYPEFYTEEEMSQIENADENKITKETEDNNNSQEQQEEIIKTDKETETVLKEPIADTDSKDISVATLVAVVENIPDDSIETPLNSNPATGTAAKKTSSRTNGNGTKNGTSSNRSSGNGRKPSNSANSSVNSSEKKPAANKKINLKDIDKDIPDDIKEKLYDRPAGGKTDAVLKRLDAMQKDYTEQKLNISKTPIPYEPDGIINAENSGTDTETSRDTEEPAAVEYNDYPFDDEPYKMMDMAAMVMSGNTAPYNDNPYEDYEVQESGNDVEEDDIGDAVEVMEYIREPIEYTKEQFEIENIENTVNVKEEEILNIPHEQNIIPFNIENAIQYAHRWALDRNSEYLDFDELGGDCTNYISQILFAGGCPMDKTPVLGWYYTDGNNKSPSWTGVEHLYKYLVKEKEFGIIAHEIELNDVRAGDIVQLSFNGKTFQHTPFIVSVGRNSDNSVSCDKIKICAHSFDSENRPLDTYKWRNIRFIRILGYK